MASATRGRSRKVRGGRPSQGGSQVTPDEVLVGVRLAMGDGRIRSLSCRPHRSVAPMDVSKSAGVDVSSVTFPGRQRTRSGVWLRGRAPLVSSGSDRRLVADDALAGGGPCLESAVRAPPHLGHGLAAHRRRPRPRRRPGRLAKGGHRCPDTPGRGAGLVRQTRSAGTPLPSRQP